MRLLAVLEEVETLSRKASGYRFQVFLLMPVAFTHIEFALSAKRLPDTGAWPANCDFGHARSVVFLDAPRHLAFGNESGLRHALWTLVFTGPGSILRCGLAARASAAAGNFSLTRPV